MMRWSVIKSHLTSISDSSNLKLLLYSKLKTDLKIEEYNLLVIRKKFQNHIANIKLRLSDLFFSKLKMVDTKLYQDTKDCVKFVVNWIDHSFLDCQQSKPLREQLFLTRGP